MKKFKLFISKPFICSVFISFIAAISVQSIDAQELKGNSQNNTENSRVKTGNSPALDLKNIPEEAYHPGIIRIQFNRDFENSLEKIDFEITGNDYVKTGIPALDKLNKAFRVHEYKPMLKNLYRVSKASVRNREKHKEWGFHLWYDLKLDNTADVIKAAIDFKKLEEIKIAQPVLKTQLIETVDSKPAKENDGGSKWTPNDPLYKDHQWHFNNTGQIIGGQPGLVGMDCNAEAAWDIETGNPDVIVAIIDSGMEYYHEDLEGNMWDLIGPDGTATIPDLHGTLIGGILGAVTNNNTGVAGLAGGSGSDDGVRLMSIDIINGSLSPPGAFIYAADNGAAIAQNSWGYALQGNFPPETKDAIDYFNEEGGGDALDGGITIFAAGNNNDNGEYYPAYYEGTIAVAAHDNQGAKSVFSNYGDWIDIIAPGTDITATIPDNEYGTYCGTSEACPHVSGAAALVVSNAYGMLTNTELWDILIESTNDDIYNYNPGYTGMLGSGRLDAYAALLLLKQEYTVTFNITDEDGDEITNAIVTFDGVTNDPGDYIFEEIEEGNYDYIVEKEGYLTEEDEVYVDDDITVEVIMIAETYTVTFNVKDEDSDEITDAIVTFDGVTNDPGDYVFEVIEAGTYDYKVEKDGFITVEDDIIVDSDTVVEVVMEIDDTFIDMVENAELSVFPNPARDKLTVRSNEMIKQIRLFDISGQTVKNITVNDLRIKINISNLETGIYVIQVHTARNVINKRVRIVP